jgi:hypothetical protein
MKQRATITNEEGEKEERYAVDDGVCFSQCKRLLPIAISKVFLLSRLKSTSKKQNSRPTK